MKIRHRLTGEEKEMPFYTWWTSVQDKENYEVVEKGDTVVLLELQSNGEKEFLYEIDRDHAIRMMNKSPGRYSWMETDDVPYAVKKKLNLVNQEGESLFRSEPERLSQRLPRSQAISASDPSKMTIQKKNSSLGIWKRIKIRDLPSIAVVGSFIIALITLISNC